MAEAVPIVLPKEGVSDDSYLLLECRKQDGQQVEANEVIALCESSKATIEITAPCRGFIRFQYRAGQEVPVGGALAFVAASAEASLVPTATAAPAPAAAAVKRPGPELAGPVAASMGERVRFTPLARKMMEEYSVAPGEFNRPGLVKSSDVLDRVETPVAKAATRFSRAALELIGKQGLSQSLFDRAGLVTREDVARLVSGAAAATGGNASIAPPPTEEKTERIPVARAKRSEIQALKEGMEGSLASAITVLVSGEGYFDPRTGAAHPLLLAIVVYESARLLRSYPDFNAFYSDGYVSRHVEVNVGVAFEIDQGLKVPVIGNADHLSIDEIRTRLDECIGKYLEGKLDMADLTGGTFTVTDLSNDGVFSFFPLISRQQSSILGIGGAQDFSDRSRMFPLTLTFDHRASTGRQASRFLSELKQRLESFAAPLQEGRSLLRPRQCRQCKREESELRERQYLLVAIQDGRADYLCTTCAKGW